MKLFIAALIAFCALTAFSQQVECAGWNSRSSSKSSDEYNDSNDAQQQQRNVENQLSELISQANHEIGSSNSNRNNYASQFTAATPYQLKINERLNQSETLSDKSEIKRKLMKLASEKFNKCQTQSGRAVDKHCCGRVTGHMMQLIAAVENVSRNVAGQ